MKTKILTDFQICISVPLINNNMFKVKINKNKNKKKNEILVCTGKMKIELLSENTISDYAQAYLEPYLGWSF